MIQNVTLTKAESNMGFTLNRENFFTVCPEADVGSGNYRFKLGEYVQIGSVWKSIYEIMRPGEVISIENIIRMYNGIK